MKRRLLLVVSFAAAAVGVTGVVRAAETKVHHVAYQVDVNDPALMNEVLNNLDNMFSYYQQRGEAIAVEVVAFGPGITMLLADLSPVKERIAKMHTAHPSLVFSACQNTLRHTSEAEGQEVQILPEARRVPSGVVRLSELQEQGWSYLRP